MADSAIPPSEGTGTSEEAELETSWKLVFKSNVFTGSGFANESFL